MTECIFCRILERREEAEVLYRTQRVVVILDINPIHFGHVLVIPKTHAETFLGVPEVELPELIQSVQVVSRAIVDVFKPEGFNIFSNNGMAAGQSVFHFHLHVTPRYADDNIQFILKLKRYAQDDLKEIASQLREHIKPNSVLHNL